MKKTNKIIKTVLVCIFGFAAGVLFCNGGLQDSTAIEKAGESQTTQKTKTLEDRICSGAVSKNLIRPSENIILNKIYLKNAKDAEKKEGTDLERFQAAKRYYNNAFSLLAKDPRNVRESAKLTLRMLPIMPEDVRKAAIFEIIRGVEHACNLEPENAENHHLYAKVMARRLGLSGETPALTYSLSTCFDATLCGLEHCLKAIYLKKRADEDLQEIRSLLLIYWLAFAPDDIFAHFVEADPDGCLELLDKHLERSLSYISKEGANSIKDESDTLKQEIKNHFVFSRFRVFFIQKKYDKAIKELDRLPSNPGEIATRNFHKMHIYRVSKQYAKAIELANSSTVVAPLAGGPIYVPALKKACHFVRLELAMTYFDMKEYDKVKETLAEVGLTPPYASTRHRTDLLYARLAYQKKDYESSFKHYFAFFQTTTIPSVPVQDILDYSNVCKKLGKKEEAEKFRRIAKFGEHPLWMLKDGKWQPVDTKTKELIKDEKPPK